MPQYDYPRPMLTVDIFLLRLHTDHFEILLIQRRNDPFTGKWALPGGYVEIDEPLEAAAKRELFEETGIQNTPLFKMNLFGDPGRDPRGRTITVVYFGVPAESVELPKAGDDAMLAQWFSLGRLPDLAFDHDRIIDGCYHKFKSNLLLRLWFLLFVDDEFSTKELSQLANMIDYELKEDKIKAILINVPFVKAKRKNVFRKEIGNEDLLKLSDADFSEIWSSILLAN